MIPGIPRSHMEAGIPPVHALEEVLRCFAESGGSEQLCQSLSTEESLREKFSAGGVFNNTVFIYLHHLQSRLVTQCESTLSIEQCVS